MISDMSLRFRIAEPDHSPREVPIVEGMVFGRVPETDCMLNDPKVSSRHAQVVRLEGGLALEDLGSTNKTRVDGGPPLAAGERQPLTEGLVLWLGRTRVEVVGHNASAAMPTSAEPPSEEVTLMARQQRDELRDPPSSVMEAPSQGSDFEPTLVAPDMPIAAAAGDDVDRAFSQMASDTEPPTAKTARNPAKDRQRGKKSRPAKAPPAATPSAGPGPQLGNDAASQEPPDAGTVHLLFDGAKGVRSVALRFKQSGSRWQTIIGRSQNADVKLEDGSVSGRHASLFFGGGLCYLEDLKSTNGTWMGEDQLASEEPTPLATDQWLRFGGVDALFLGDRDAAGNPIPEERYEMALGRLRRQGRIDADEERKALIELVEGRRHPGQLLIESGKILPIQWAEAYEDRQFKSAKAGPGASRETLLKILIGVILAIGLAGLAYLIWSWLG